MRWRLFKIVMFIAFWILPSHCSGQEVAKIVSGDRHYGAVVLSEMSESSRMAAGDLYFGPGSAKPAAPIGEAAIGEGGVVFVLSSYSCRTFRRFDQSRRMNQ